MGIAYLFLLVPFFSSFTNVQLFSHHNVESTGFIVSTYYNGNTTYNCQIQQGNDVKVGTETQQLGGSNFVTFQYTPIFKCNFPKYSSVINAELTLTVKSGNLTNVSAGIYSSNAFIGSPVPTLVNSLGIIDVLNGIITIDVTTDINQQLQNNNDFLYVGVSRSYGGSFGLLYNRDDDSLDVSPLLTIHTQSPTVTGVGAALTYQLIEPSPNTSNIGQANCHCYAMNSYKGLSGNPGDQLVIPQFYYYKYCTYSESLMIDYIIPNMKESSYNHCKGVFRDLESKDSSIYSFEYRVAFRIEKGYDPEVQGICILGYHFIRQDSDGGWSGKYPSSATTKYASSFDPDIDLWATGTWETVYYFAFSKLI